MSGAIRRRASRLAGAACVAAVGLGLGLPAHADQTDALVQGLLEADSGALAQAPRGRDSTRAKRHRAKKAKKKAGRNARAAKAESEGADAASSAAEDSTPARRKVVITDFAGPSGQLVRQTVLDVFSRQSDVEVVGYNDIEVVAKRLGVDPRTEGGRGALSGELGIDGWIDGRVTADGAEITLSDRGGALVAQVTLKGRSAGALREQAQEKVWHGLGPHVSKSERRRQLLESYKEAAAEKLQAREVELARQRELALERERARKRRLEEARELAIDKQAARLQEKQRQRQLANERRLAAERERQRKAEEQRRKLAELQRQRAAQQAPAQPPQQTWRPSPGSGGSAPAGAAQPANGVSPATQRWLEQRRAAGGYAPPAQPAPVQPAPVQGQPAPAVDPSTLSPATRKWLQERQRERQER